VLESSEQGMLAQVARADRRGEPIVFLGWEPHPMNANFDMTYLTGGDDWFGPDFGGATVYTNTRAGFVAECPNVGQFLQNLEFTLEMENEIMGAILNDGAEPVSAAERLAAGQPRGARRLARWRDHQGRRRRGGGRQGSAGALSFRGARPVQVAPCGISALSISAARTAAGRSDTRPA
jgi:glycine betaine/proline transport system substrate-binding protein